MCQPSTNYPPELVVPCTSMEIKTGRISWHYDFTHGRVMCEIWVSATEGKYDLIRNKQVVFTGTREEVAVAEEKLIKEIIVVEGELVQ